MRKLPSCRQISQRQRDEELRASYASKVEREQGEKQFADWVNNTNEKILNRRKLQVVDQCQKMHQKTVEERRERLAALLIAEQEEYFKALDAMVETQDQRRQRLATRALELKQQREARRKELAQTKLDQAFRENCDVLREAESKVNLLQVVADRAKQLQWKEAKKQEQAEDDRFFDEMWEQERLKKVQRAQEDMERTQRMNAQLRAHLDAQKEAYHLLKKREAELKAEEDRIYKEQIEFELRMEAQRERERQAEAHALGRAAKEHNEMMRAEKARQERLNREEDLKELQTILAQIKEEDELDQKRKMERRQEMLRYQEALREHMNQEAQNEAEMEKLWIQETEKAWAKREATWKKEQDARDKLLRDVCEERARQLHQKMESLRQQKKDQDAEKERLLQEMEAAAQVEADKARERKEWMMENQADLVQQMNEKSYLRTTAKKENDLERISNALAEEEFRRKVQKELDAVETKKPQQFRNIRTLARPF